VSRRGHPWFARAYERASVAMDAAGGFAHRRALVAGLAGRVVEIGAGNGRMFVHYPAAVTAVVAVEPEPRLRASALAAARDAAVPIEVVEGVAESLPAADGTFDAAVASLVLCSVPHQPTALAEIHRVLRPGGELRFFEHVRGDGALRRVQRVADATVWPLLCAGCHTGRDTPAAITAAGFEITELSRFRFPPTGPTMPAAPHVLGRAAR
jgi:ubiquinone/menaquinone biosynthesis C-methylase UbiE